MAEQARLIAKTRYDKGVGLYQELLESESNAIRAERSMCQLRGQQLIASVSLIKALGGGWNQKMPTVVPRLKSDKDSQTEKATAPKKSFLKRLFGKN